MGFIKAIDPLMSINKYILFFIFISSLVLSQTKKDTLRKKLSDPDINIKVEACSEFAWELHHFNIDSALYYAQKAESWITKDVTDLNKAYVYHILGSVYCSLKQYPAAIPWLEKAYIIRKKENDVVQVVATISNLVYATQGIGDIKRTLNYAFESEQICDKFTNSDPHLYIMTLTQLADVYKDLKRYEKAEALFNKALAKAEQRGKAEDLSIVYQNYGAYFIAIEQYEKAFPYLEKGIKQQEKLNEPDELFDAKINLAIVYAESGRMEEAGKIFKEVYEYKKKSGSDYDKSTSSNNLGFFYFTAEKYKEAIKLFFESIGHAKNAKAPRLVMQRYEVLSASYENMGDIPNALKYYKLWVGMKDSLFNEETVKQLNNLTEKYEVDKKERKILELQKNNVEIKLKEEEAKRASQRNTIILGSLMVLVLAVAAFIYISLVQKRKANASLTSKNKQIELQNVLLEEKQKEILDSIHYAKRIQQSLMPTEKYFTKNLTKFKKNS